MYVDGIIITRNGRTVRELPEELARCMTSRLGSLFINASEIELQTYIYFLFEHWHKNATRTTIMRPI